MEVGKHRAYHAEVKAWIDEDVSLALAWSDAAVQRLADGELESANGRGTNRNDAAAGISSAIQLGRCGFRDRVDLLVEAVIFDSLSADRLKRAEADMKGDFSGCLLYTSPSPRD